MSTGVGMSSCCLSGKIHDGTPVGHVEEIGGLQTYVSEPESKSKAKTIIFLVDSKASWRHRATWLEASFTVSLMYTLSLTIFHSLRLGVQERPSPGR